MKKTLVFISICGFVFALSNCKKEKDTPDDTYVPPVGTSVIASSAQRDNGNAATGYTYLTSGDYISSGIPYNYYILTPGSNDPANVLGRTGHNATIPPTYTAVNAPNGVEVVAPNCLQCHGSYLNGSFVVGLGNAAGDFTTDQSNLANTADGLINTLGTPQEKAAYAPFSKSIHAIGPNVVTEVRGVNVADKVAAVLAAHRDQHSLVWNDNPTISIPTEVIPTDIPPWWHMKKKNAMFYNGMGRGDFARYLMASSLLTMVDSSKANEVNEKFPDILAYIKSIQPPAYPQGIDANLASEGKTIFAGNCAKCHGTYGDGASYPNLLVELTTVGTDPKLANAYNLSIYNVFKDWFNNGWFGKDPNGAELVPANGYVAQPLDGIWASAPYLHNGSVPTLEDLLNSSQRPAYWKRTFADNDYNYTKVGWNYANPGSKTDKETYDVSIDGYGNQGHTFGDALTTQQRTALIEYLKTL
ncbi:MAG: c-type cytochrome [Bacteroidota bacterium]